MAFDSSQIQIIIDALNRTRAQFSQVLSQMGQIDRANVRSTQTEQRATGAIKNSAEALIGLRLGYIAAAAAAGQYARTQLATIDGLSKEARALETTTERLSGFKFAMESSGIQAAESSQQLNQLLRAMQQAAGDPTSEAAKSFQALGISLQGLDRRDVLDVTLQISDAFEKSQGAASKAAIAQVLFGRNSRATIEFLNGGSAAIRENVELYNKLGGTVKTLTADQIEKFNDHISALKVTFKGFALAIFDEVLPALNKFSTKLTDILSGKLGTGARMALLGPVGTLLLGANAPSGSNVPPTLAGSAEGDKANLPNPELLAKLQEEKKASLEMKDKLSQELLQREADFIPSRERLQRAALDQERLNHLKNDEEIKKLTLVSDDGRRELELLESKRFVAANEAIIDKARDEELTKWKELQQKKKQLRDMELSGTSEMFGNLASIAKAFGREGVVAYKVFAIAQATIDGIKASLGAFAWGNEIGGPILGGVAAGIAAGAAAAQIATIASVNPGFAEGGFTGQGGTHEVAGPVHRSEVVIPAKTVRAFGLDHFASVYFNGRMPGHSSRGFAGGGFAGSIGTPSITAPSSSIAFNFATIDSRNAMREWMSKEGTRIVVDHLTRRGSISR